MTRAVALILLFIFGGWAASLVAIGFDEVRRRRAEGDED